jgi:hypothetical protein
MSLSDLLQVNRSVNADLERDMSAGVRATQAHVGLIELAQATADEMVRRDYATLIPLCFGG